MAFIQKVIAWIVAAVMAILGFLGIYKKPEKPVDPPTTTTVQERDPFETPEIEI